MASKRDRCITLKITVVPSKYTRSVVANYTGGLITLFGAMVTLCGIIVLLRELNRTFDLL